MKATLSLTVFASFSCFVARLAAAVETPQFLDPGLAERIVGQIAGAEFVAQPIDGDAVTGRLVSLERPWRFVLQGREHRVIDGSDLISMRRANQNPPIGPPGSQIVLGNGDRIRGVVRSATGEFVKVSSELLGEVEMPLDRVIAMVFAAPEDAQEREKFVWQLQTEQRKLDTVLLANGDRLTGTLVGIDERAARLDTGQASVEVSRAEVRAIAMSSELTSFPKPTSLYADVLLADGSCVAIAAASVQGRSLQAHAAFGSEVSVPVDQVAAMEFRGGRVTYLSDVEPVRYEHTPYLGVQFPFVHDRTVHGNAMSMRGQHFRKGLGMHSRSELTYAVDARCRRFEAIVGIDDETRGRGSVVFRVVVDDQQVWESPPLTGRSAALPVAVPLQNARQLTLIVDFADSGDVQDHADWGEARLVR